MEKEIVKVNVMSVLDLISNEASVHEDWQAVYGKLLLATLVVGKLSGYEIDEMVDDLAHGERAADAIVAALVASSKNLED